MSTIYYYSTDFTSKSYFLPVKCHSFSSKKITKWNTENVILFRMSTWNRPRPFGFSGFQVFGIFGLQEKAEHTWKTWKEQQLKTEKPKKIRENRKNPKTQEKNGNKQKCSLYSQVTKSVLRMALFWKRRGHSNSVMVSKSMVSRSCIPRRPNIRVLR